MPRPSRRSSRQSPKVQAVIGVGLDNSDGETRITRTEEMVLLGGSRETHEQMQETAIRFSEALEKTGKKLPEVSLRQAWDLLREAQERSR